LNALLPFVDAHLGFGSQIQSRVDDEHKEVTVGQRSQGKEAMRASSRLLRVKEMNPCTF